MQEQEIIELLLKHDESGISALLKHYGPLMRYIIAPILPNKQDQEECLSEIAMRVWNKIGLFHQQRGSWNAWLTSVTRNVAINRARQNRHWESIENIPENTPSPELTPEEAILYQERQEAVNHAIQQLSPKERILFYRKYYYLQSTSQIASELGMTERAVEGKLYRLKKQLRKILGGGGYETS